MDPKKEIEFSDEKLLNSITTLNKLSEKIIHNKQSKPLADEETKLKKIINYIKKFAKKVLKEDEKEKILFLLNLMKISQNSLKNSGDEFLELLWEMYDIKNFHIYNLDFSPSYYEYFLHFFFLNNKNLDYLIKKQLIIIDKEKRKIESHLELDKNNFEEIFKNQFETTQPGHERVLEREMSLIEKKNFMIDLLILEIFCNSQISLFYTSLSSFIINTESNVMLLFKGISLFALCLWNLDKKENFVGSLIYVIGGVLRDHGRSYLKTKGILNENLSYHVCTGHDNKHSHYFTPKILTSKECSYLELYFLSTMKEFLKTIFSGIQLGSLKIYLDDCIPIYFRYLDQQNDSPDNFSHLPEIQIFHFVNLFLSDFLFFFVTNFCTYEGRSHTEDNSGSNKNKLSHRHMFSTNFSNFEDFIDYSLSIINVSFRNITKLCEISEMRRRLQETECEKTEYQMKDGYNHYGVCLIFYLYLNGGYSPVNILNEKDFVFETSFLPMNLKKDFYLRLYLEALSFILCIEIQAENKFMKDYKAFCNNFLKDIKKILLDNEISESDANFKTVVNILSEFVEFEDKDKTKEVFELVKNREKLLFEALIQSTNKERIIKLLKMSSDDLKFKHETFFEFVKSFVFRQNAFIFDEGIKCEIFKKLPTDQEQKKILHKDLSSLLDDLKKNEKNVLLSNLEFCRELIDLLEIN